MHECMYTYLRDIGPLSSPRPSFPGFGPLDLMASCFCLLKPQLVIFTTGDDRFSILTCPPSLIQILWKGIMESTSWFDGFSLLHTQAATLLILTTRDDMPPWVWSRFFEKKRWSQLQLHFRLPPCLVIPRKCFGFQVFSGKGWLFAKIVFSCGIFGISKLFQTQKIILIAQSGHVTPVF